MMNRNVRESLVGGRNFPASQNHRRGGSLNLPALSSSMKQEHHDESSSLDLFSKSRRTLSVASSDDSSDVSVKLGRLSVGSGKVGGRTGIDDLLSSADGGGKHDYDWLLTPPETPLFPSSDGSESQPTLAAARSSALNRSTSSAKPSRLSVSQSESNHSSRPARSSSVTRSSISSSQYTNYSSNRSSNFLNTSSASVSSYSRPSSPITRSPSTARPSTPTSRASLSRPSTPSRTRNVLTSSSIERPRSVASSRPSTPSSRPQIPANLSSPAARTPSRPSTPTRRHSLPSLSIASSPSPSAGRLSNGRNPAPTSRPSSPSPRVRPPPQPIVPHDFPLDTPPNLRTTLPDRPISAGRSRPGAAVVVKGKLETPAAVVVPRRQSSPIVSRGRLTEAPGRSRVLSNGHHDVPEPRKAQHLPDLGMRKPVKTSSTPATDNSGFGRNISKKSLDMAIRHMDIKNGTGNSRQLSGSTLFPQSIRSGTPKTQSVCTLSSSASVNMNGGLQSRSNGVVYENGNNMSRPVENGTAANGGGRYSAKLTDVDIYESSRYDAILLKEDLKNTNWLHSLDDKLDEGPIFDNGFEHLPEPFGLL
ncbi:uncharacterized protein LOC133723854 [Rosa rugosa]|uniref:uncharacterized protein LOC133723854 n=1 Tax=Rosa rugosa TaxID=74645 RepID=UPI002B403DEB|nr:uncharacterized protein LOC133723854 [Rosa rugosa]